jgi:hypothetical protein
MRYNVRQQMEPSNTVRASFAIMVIWIVGVMVKIIPEVISQASGYWWFWGVFVVFAAIRLFILFWQTLADAVHSRRLGWVVAHVLFGPFASAAYYMTAEPQSLDIPTTTSTYKTAQPIKLNQPNKS